MDAIVKSYGSYEEFTVAFGEVASGHFASGWAWLVKKEDGSVEVSTKAKRNGSREKIQRISHAPLTVVCDYFRGSFIVLVQRACSGKQTESANDSRMDWTRDVHREPTLVEHTTRAQAKLSLQ